MDTVNNGRSMLSWLQRSILRWLIEAAEQQNRDLLVTGVQWRLLVDDKEGENAFRSSICRTLARLERRGLIKRIKGRKNKRTVRVLLTESGRALAEATE